jgi:guanylate kinase
VNKREVKKKGSMKRRFENAHKKLRWKSDFDKSVVIENFEDREWDEASDDSTIWPRML